MNLLMKRHKLRSRFQKALGGLFLLTVLTLAGCENSGNQVVEVAEDPQPLGDDTYVPSFSAGDLRFEQVWVEDTAEAGMETRIAFEMTNNGSDNISDLEVRFDLKRLSEGHALELDVNNEGFVPDYLGAYLELEPIVPGETRQVQHTFTVPPQVTEDTYAGVFRVIYRPSDGRSTTQSVAAAPGSIIIGKPTLPNLRILSHSLGGRGGNSFEIPRKQPPSIEDASPLRPEDDPAFVLNLEVESMAQHTLDPVELELELNIPGYGSYPLLFTDNTPQQATDAMGNQRTVARLRKTGVFEKECQRIDANGAVAHDWTPPDPGDDGVICAGLFRQHPTGRVYEIYLTEEIVRKLYLLPKDQITELVIRLDPGNKVAEWRGNTSDNVLRLPVMFLKPEPAPTARTQGRSTDRSAGLKFNGPYDESILFFDTSKQLGVDAWNAGYVFYSDTNYQWEGWIPGAFYTKQKDEVWVTANDMRISIFNLDVDLDLNLDNILGSYFEYDVWVPALERTARPVNMLVGKHQLGFPEEYLDTSGAQGVQWEASSESEDGRTAASLPLIDTDWTDKISGLNSLINDACTTLDSGKSWSPFGNPDFANFIKEFEGKCMYTDYPSMLQPRISWISLQDEIPYGTGISWGVNPPCTYRCVAPISAPDVLKTKVIGSPFDMPDEKIDTRPRFKDCESAAFRFSEITIWSTLDPELQEERFIYYLESVYNNQLVIQGVPINITAGFFGQIGLTANLKLKPENKLTFDPVGMAEANGFAEVSLGADIGFAKAKVGIGAQLQLLKMTLGLDTVLQILPSLPRASFSFDVPFSFSPFGGKVWFTLNLTVDVPIIGTVGIPINLTLMNFNTLMAVLGISEFEFSIFDVNWIFPNEKVANPNPVFDPFVSQEQSKPVCIAAVCDGLIGYYRMNGDLEDSSVEDPRSARINGGVSGAMDRSRNLNFAYRFNGDASESISIGGSAIPGGNADFSYAFWVRPEEANRLMTLMDIGRREDNRRSALQMNASNQLQYVDNSAQSLGIDLPTDHWTHLVLTKSGTVIQVYVNGDTAGSVVTGIANLDLNNATDSDGASISGVPVSMGRSSNLDINDRTKDADAFKGVLDELHLFNRALTADEVKTIYRGERPSLVAYLTMDGNADDASTMNAHAQTVGGVSPTTDRLGQPNSAYRFRGNEEADSLQIESSGTPTYTHPHPLGDVSVTYTAWIYPQSSGARMSIVDAGDREDNKRSAMILDASGKLTYTAEGNKIVFAQATVPVGKWSHVAITKVGTLVKAYLNGTLVGKELLGEGQELTSSRVYIGRNTGDPDNPAFPGASLETFNGRIDEVQIHRRNLSDTEISSVYQGEEL
jgi:hypothetical protein